MADGLKKKRGDIYIAGLPQDLKVYSEIDVLLYPTPLAKSVFLASANNTAMAFI